MWLLTLWLAFHQSVPDRDSATGIVADIYQLSDAAGRPGSLAAITLLAYIVGAITEVNSNWLLAAINVVLKHIPRAKPIEWVTSSASANLAQFVRTRLAPLRPAEAGDREELEARLWEIIANDRDQIAIRLQNSRREMYADHDRLAAEADFRVNVGIALLGPVAVLSSHDPYFLFSLALPIWLVFRGLMRLRQSNDVLAQALVKDQADSSGVTAFMEELAAAAQAS